MSRAVLQLALLTVFLIPFAASAQTSQKPDCPFIVLRAWTEPGTWCSPGVLKWFASNKVYIDCRTGLFPGPYAWCDTGTVNDWIKYSGREPNETSCGTPLPPAIFDACNENPQPNQCKDGRPTGEASSDPGNDLGDPVDISDGSLEWDATDLDLGGALVFRRHYASDRFGQFTSYPIGAFGRLWGHALDWRVTRSGPFSGVTMVLVWRPFRSPAPYAQASPTAPFAQSLRNGGTLAVDASGNVSYVGEDGVQATFDASNRLVSLIHPGEAPVAVSYGTDSATYVQGSRSATVTFLPTGHANAGRIASVVGGGETWTYAYDSSQNLVSVTGPDRSTEDPNDVFQWSYSYASPGMWGRMTAVGRTVGSTTTTLATWGWSGGSRVTSANEPSLEQSLVFSYAIPALGQLVTTVKNASAQTLATFNASKGALTGATGLGGPGVGVDFASGVRETVASTMGPRWRTKADKNGNVTLYDGYDTHGNPLRVVEGWIDDGTSPGVFDPADHWAARRESTWHPTLRKPLTVVTPSVVSGAMERITLYDYDDPATPGDDPFAANEAPTEHVFAKVESGRGIDAASGTEVAVSRSTVYEYDAAGHVTAEIGPSTSGRTEHGYDPTTGFRTSTRRYLNGAGSGFLETIYSDFDASGNAQTVTDANGRVTLFTYDGRNRVKTVVPPDPGPDDPTVRFSYDIDGNLVRIDFPPDSFLQPAFLRLGYDTKNRLTFLADAAGNAIVYEYTGGRATREASYSGFVDLANRGTLRGDAQFSFDQAGRLLKAFNPLFSGGSVFSEFGHDNEGNRTSVTDENGRHDTLLYDALDRLTQIEQVRSATYATGFSYDPASNVKQVTDAAGKQTDYQFDDLGSLVRVVSPDTGATRYGYDAAGNLVRKVEDATGTPRTTLYTYDGLDRLTLVDLPGDPDWVFTYDTSAAQNQKGRLAAASNGIITTGLAWTPRGEIATETTTVDGEDYAVSYGYDAAGNRTAVQTPSGVTATTQYAGLRPKTVAVTAGSSTETIRELAFFPFGPRTRAELPPFDGTTGANTVVSTREYNLRSQVSEIDVTAPMSGVLDRSYTYHYTSGTPGPVDPGPNLDRVIDHRDAGESRFYVYDQLDRLWKATDLSGSPRFEYVYDAAGNRTSLVTAAGTTMTTYESGTDRIAQQTGATPKHYAHDAFGNRIYAGVAPYTGSKSHLYDQSNRLVELRDPGASTTLATYTYDAFGRRVKKTVAGQTTLFSYDSEGHVIEQLAVNPSGDDTAEDFVWVEDEPMGLVRWTKEVGSGGGGGSGTPAFTWIHTDQLAMTDTPATPASAKTVWRASHEPFGLAAVQTDPDGDGTHVSLDLRFPGQVFDAESGLHQNFLRTYDPSSRRYLEPDPAGIPAVLALHLGGKHVGPDRIDGRDAVGLPDSETSLYDYAALNPIGRTDPLGLSSLHTRLAVAIAQGNASALRKLIGTGALSAQQEARASAAFQRFGSTEEEIIGRECLATVQRKFPSELLQETLEQIMRLARGGSDAARTALELTNDSRFKK